MEIFTCEQLKQAVEKGAVLLDVRSESEFRRARLPSAKLISVSQLNKVPNEIDKSTKILAYCRTGSRSEHAARILSEWGYDAINVGGMVHYKQCIQY